MAQDPRVALTDEQQHALLRFLGRRQPADFVVGAPGSHFVRVQGERALKLTASHTLPGTRTVRYVVVGQTIYVADVQQR